MPEMEQIPVVGSTVDGMVIEIPAGASFFTLVDGPRRIGLRRITAYLPSGEAVHVMASMAHIDPSRTRMRVRTNPSRYFPHLLSQAIMDSPDVDVVYAVEEVTGDDGVHGDGPVDGRADGRAEGAGQHEDD